MVIGLFGSSDAGPCRGLPPGCANRILFASRAGFMEIGLEVSKTLVNALECFLSRSIVATTRAVAIETKQSYFSYC